MGRITGKRESYGHRIMRLSSNLFRIQWTFDTKIKGSRLRWPRTITRDTDFDGAVRFAKKWGLKAPERIEPRRTEGWGGI